jgi:hypothetical protein
MPPPEPARDTPPAAPARDTPAPATPVPFTPPPAAEDVAAPPPSEPPRPTPAPVAPPPSEPRLPAAAEPSAFPPRAVVLASVGAVAILGVVLVVLHVTGVTRWNLFAAFSPFAAAGMAVAAFVVARGRLALPLAAGILTGLGVIGIVGALALLRFANNWLEGTDKLLAVVTLAGAAAILAAGLVCRRAQKESAAAQALDPGLLVLGIAGAALAAIALFVAYDGYSSLWSELQDGDQAEYFFAPAAAVATMVAGLVVLGSRPRFAAGLLIAAGGAAALGYLGLIFAAWQGIGEPGDVKAAGFVGLLGGALALAAGWRAARRADG